MDRDVASSLGGVRLFSEHLSLGSKEHPKSLFEFQMCFKVGAVKTLFLLPPVNCLMSLLQMSKIKGIEWGNKMRGTCGI